MTNYDAPLIGNHVTLAVIEYRTLRVRCCKTTKVQ